MKKKYKSPLFDERIVFTNAYALSDIDLNPVLVNTSLPFENTPDED